MYAYIKKKNTEFYLPIFPQEQTFRTEHETGQLTGKNRIPRAPAPASWETARRACLFSSKNGVIVTPLRKYRIWHTQHSTQFLLECEGTGEAQRWRGAWEPLEMESWSQGSGVEVPEIYSHAIRHSGRGSVALTAYLSWILKQADKISMGLNTDGKAARSTTSEGESIFEEEIWTGFVSMDNFFLTKSVSL